MKIAAAVVIGVGVVVAIVVCVGALLPRHHVAARTRLVRARPEDVFRLIDGPQDWRTDLKSYKFYDQGSRRMAQETDKHAQTITFEIVESRPPTLLKRTIADKNLPFGGSWTWQLEPVGENCRITITEDGEVYNPVFRFLSKFVIGQTRTIDNYLDMLSQALEKTQRANTVTGSL